MVDVNIPMDVILSVLIVIRGCGCPNSFNVVLIGTAILALWKTPIVSASAAEDMTLRIVLHSVWMGPLGFGSGVFVLGGIRSLR